MPKKKTKKKATKRKKTVARAGKRLLKKTIRTKSATKKAVPKKKKKTVAKAKVSGIAKGRVKTTATGRGRAGSRGQNFSAQVLARPARLGLAGQAGDLQGLSSVEGADSESVDELIEEGNAFEADVVSGVERAGNNDEEEVHTHEVPEDDVPEEYLDQD